MKKFIKDEMNINDIINGVDLNEILYTVELEEGVEKGNVLKLTCPNDISILNLHELDGLDYFENEYVVLSISDGYIYLKEIPMT